MKAYAYVSYSTYDILNKSSGNKRNMSKTIMSLHTILIIQIQCSNTTRPLYTSEAPCYSLNRALTFDTLLQKQSQKIKCMYYAKKSFKHNQ